MNSNKLFRIRDFVLPTVTASIANQSHLDFVSLSISRKKALSSNRLISAKVCNGGYKAKLSLPGYKRMGLFSIVKKYVCSCTDFVPNIFWYSTYYKTSYMIVRPLMGCLRCTVTMTCILGSLPVYPDFSNLKMQYSRNRIRKQIIPAIAFFFNPKIEKAIFQFSEFYKNASF